jgi:hypothetical protein
MALMGMWVRSYWWEDGCFWGTSGFTYGFTSYRGDIRASKWDMSAGSFEFYFESRRITPDFQEALGIVPDFSLFGIGFGAATSQFPLFWDIVLPYWLLIAVNGILAGLLWYRRYLRFKFSLSTFLILVTLVALLLGYIAWKIHSL